MNTPWMPEGFDDWPLHFPVTPFVRPAAHLDWTGRFISCWDNPTPSLPRSTLVVLVAGLFSEWLPRCFQDCAQALRDAGYQVLRMPVRSSRGVMAQGRHISKVLTAELQHGQRFVLLAHSKGGLDALAALSQDKALSDACDGVALVQPPTGPSTVMDDVLGCAAGQPGHSYPLDRVRRVLAKTPWMAAGTRDISSLRDPQIAQLLNQLPADLHATHVVSWTAAPSSRFDTHHARLNAQRPGCAHDGQFYIENLRIEGMPQICLPHLDHGQPVLGGGGFDATRFWLTLLNVLHETRPGQTR
ncbi:esterase/lipase family protein [Pseudomonas frederiksbergensis]|uniref:esterase/lipase family protein n=1 Tax=Pseudomonas frederiksbergensis TaxID=104087 RepID=UPI003D25A079